MTRYRTDNLSALSHEALREIRRGWQDERRCLLTQQDDLRQTVVPRYQLLNRLYLATSQARNIAMTELERQLTELDAALLLLDTHLAGPSWDGN